MYILVLIGLCNNAMEYCDVRAVDIDHGEVVVAVI